MTTHDDQPGAAGGHPEERSGGAQAPTGATAKAPSGIQTPGTGTYNYYEDDEAGYSTGDPTSLVAQHRSDEYYDELARERSPLAWNAGADLGLLVLRLALGALFLAHGAQKLFGAFGGPGSEGFAQALEKMGYQQAPVLSMVTGVTEFGAGALLVLGLFTPLAAAGILGVMANVVFSKLGAGFFETSGGFEFQAMLGAVALGLMFTGPGRVALDNGRAWYRRPVISGFLCLVLAAAASAVVLTVFHR